MQNHFNCSLFTQCLLPCLILSLLLPLSIFLSDSIRYGAHILLGGSCIHIRKISDIIYSNTCRILIGYFRYKRIMEQYIFMLCSTLGLFQVHIFNLIEIFDRFRNFVCVFELILTSCSYYIFYSLYSKLLFICHTHHEFF